ncbi:MAG: holo-ACP synthase [Acidimicrobiales bacterium]
MGAPRVGDFVEIAVGIDSVDVPRFRRLLGRRPGLAGRLFTAAETAYAARFTDPAPRLAARFAAKEAAVKALGVGLGAVRFHDLAVDRLASGAPVLRVAGRAAELAREQGVGGWALSLTHTDLVAAAVVIAQRSGGS